MSSVERDMAVVASDVMAIVAKRVRSGKTEIKPDDRLEDLGIELIDAVEMIFDLEEKYDVEIPYNANKVETGDSSPWATSCARSRRWSPARHEWREPRRRHRPGAPYLRSAQRAPRYWCELARGRVRNRHHHAWCRRISCCRRSSPRSRTTIRRKHFDDRQIVTLGSRVAVRGGGGARGHRGVPGSTFDGRLSEQTATIIGTGVGGQTTQDDNYQRLYGDKAKRVYPLTIPKLMVNAPASQISMHCGLRGPAFVVASACASATHAIGLAFIWCAPAA